MFFFDESRFGTHSRIGHGWFRAGIRTAVKKKLGFKSFYVYTAASPKSGDSFTLMMPNVNTDCMNAFLSELSSWLENKNIILIVDGAGWHKSKGLAIPLNIKILYLPPYSPELNPIEKLWQYIKDNILKNTVYENLKLLEEKLYPFINNINNLDIMSICNVNYMSYYL